MSSSSGFLVSLPFPSNVGYAIKPLEQLFFSTALNLVGNQRERVHFSYTSISEHPSSLPADFSNLLAFDYRAAAPSDIKVAQDYVRSHKIGVALFFDLQPSHPILPALRAAGISKVVSYWGAPISDYSPLWKLLIKQMLIRLDTSKVDGLIFESEAMADRAVRGRGFPAERISVVPLGIDITSIRPTTSDYVHRIFSIPQDRKVVFYAGHMEERKGVSVLVKAITELLVQRKRRDVQLVVCGDRPGESERFKSIYTGHSIDDHFIFGGYRDDLGKVLPSCFCGVIPSTGWDSFPRTALEIQAAGIPIVASRLDGIPETLEAGRTGLLFDAGNHFQLADRIESLLEDLERASDMGIAARKRIEESFTLEIQSARFLQALEGFIGG